MHIAEEHNGQSYITTAHNRLSQNAKTPDPSTWAAQSPKIKKQSKCQTFGMMLRF